MSVWPWKQRRAGLQKLLKRNLFIGNLLTHLGRGPLSLEVLQDIDGLVDMKLICGTIVVRMKDRPGKEGKVSDFVYISDTAYTHDQVLIMEKRILGELEWSLTVPTPYVFLVRFIKPSVPDQQMENMVYFLAELGMLNYATIIYCPSMIVASVVYAARCTLNKSPVWNDTLKLHTGFSEPQLMDCAKLLVSFHGITAENSRRGAKEANLYIEIAEGIHSYGITGHHHVLEIEEGLSEDANSHLL